MKMSIFVYVIAGLALIAPSAWAEGIVAKIVTSPLAAATTVQGGPTSINIYLQNAEAQGDAFHDPNVIGYGLPAGGRLEIELGDGFERIASVPLTQKAIMLVPAAQQPLPGKKIGYTIGEGRNPKTFVIAATSEKGLAAETLITPVPSAKSDPIRARGIKVIHIGFLQYSFRNTGKTGHVEVRFVDGQNQIVHQGKGSIDFIDSPVPQVHPTNLSSNHQNNNWQRIKPGDVLGQKEGTFPIGVMLFARATVSKGKLGHFKQGIWGVGVLSTQQLQAMGYTKPATLSRYTGGLIVQDTSIDGKLDPRIDSIIGGVIGAAPAGAKGQEIYSPTQHEKRLLSSPSVDYSKKFGPIFGGSIMPLHFKAGDKPGLYKPTLALLRDPGDLTSGDGSQFTYTIVVE